MATITELEFDLAPGDTIDTLKVQVDTTVRFTEFDRRTDINYFLTYRLVGLDEDESGDETVLQSFPTIVIEASEGVGSELHRSDPFVIARTTADEDPILQNPDELQIRAELAPALPTTTAFRSNVVRPVLS